jgi:hypothetical protein
MIDETVNLYKDEIKVSLEDNNEIGNGVLFAVDALSAGSLLHQYDSACPSILRSSLKLQNCGHVFLNEGMKLSDDEVERTLLDSHSPSAEQYMKLVKRGFELNGHFKEESVANEQNERYGDEFTSSTSAIKKFKPTIDIYDNDFIMGSLSNVSNGIYPFESVGGTLIEGFRTAFINIFTRDCGPIGSILLGMHSSGIFRSTRVQAFKAISTPDYFKDFKWLIDKHGGMDEITMAALEETVKWIDFNFDTKQMHKLVAANRSVSSELKPQHWTWGNVHTVTWNHPVVEVS